MKLGQRKSVLPQQGKSVLSQQVVLLQSETNLCKVTSTRKRSQNELH